MRDTAELTSRLRAAGCVFAEDEAALILSTARTAGEVQSMMTRRLAGEPLEHVLGWAEFRGLRLVVAPGVFVPRRRTEFLVDRAADGLVAGNVAVDLCCGCGAVAAALVAEVPGIEIHAADLDPAAVRCARTNLGQKGSVHRGDLDDALPSTLRGRVDVLVANTPYVPTAEIAHMPPEAREHEPGLALDGGTDGLDVQRRLAARARRWLAPGARVLVESSIDQSSTTARVFERHGLTAHVFTDEDTAVVVGHAG
ncbi:putative protein N(5)-glutamine methyltransferase [Allosaccharopolyspora coralli]|uniref:peptide chain release factor N(5)-glutamine methyltransferase n=1 Tax=Allosaccharopolyspora coralli TaxID=2665642 RepID=A0A5Q3Q9Q4_9PSEU|nr:putative protein N(5)-glutamine methyltransferase [Allosaccharopolyspora coralli]QGK69934.1 putative protein N(5)-glutamine methyltransferase [Allosaccharopolyspora coralli]